MIPLSLTLSGFLSYREATTLDFTPFDLACIAGANGAGKSSLLDAITWALFGQARKRDESVINSHPGTEAARVSFAFGYENNVYRVERANPRGKTGQLEFQIATNPAEALAHLPSAAWKTLSERSLRGTQERILETLRLDYETFVNASFFLQGKADQFTQQTPSKRKEILSAILGLETWERYRQRAVENRKTRQASVQTIQGRLQEINLELTEETARKARLAELQAELSRLEQARAAQEAALETIRAHAAALAEQARWVSSLFRQVNAATQQLAALEQKLAARAHERDTYTHLIDRAPEIRAAQQAWETARARLEQWEATATAFHEHELRRHAPLTEIETARARLETERTTLLAQQTTLQGQLETLPALTAQLDTAHEALTIAQLDLSRRAALETRLQEAHARLAEARAENPRLKTEMDELKARIDQLSQAEGAACPLCGQPLTPEHRARLIEQRQAEGTQMGDQYRANTSLLKEAGQVVAHLQSEIAALHAAEAAHRLHARTVDQLEAQLAQLEEARLAWETSAAPRLAEIEAILQAQTFAPEARAALAAIDAELKAIGYDAAAHDEARRLEIAGRAAQADLHALELAGAALAPLEREIADLQAQAAAARAETEARRAEHAQAAASLAQAQAAAPDQRKAEFELFGIQEQENAVRALVGGAQLKVQVLADLKARRKAFEAEREDLARQIASYQALEVAFGKEGVPALLIEQALPLIETRANEILDRLSRGGMSIRFVTQRGYKDSSREDLKETLDLQISDAAGLRDYEMYSRGERFRVDFAIRLALSEVLAQRAGARLQTLVIDEGFGSQDAAGRQSLIEAINLVRPDFAKILVITHIEELKEAFPNRIEVEKTERGSTLRVV